MNLHREYKYTLKEAWKMINTYHTLVDHLNVKLFIKNIVDVMVV